MLVVSCNVFGSIGFRDFFIVAPAFYEVIELKKKKQIGKKSDVAEVKTINLFSYFLFPIFFSQNPVVILHTHIL